MEAFYNYLEYSIYAGLFRQWELYLNCNTV